MQSLESTPRAAFLVSRSSCSRAVTIGGPSRMRLAR